VLVELAQDGVKRLARVHDARRDAPRELLEHRVLVFLGEGDAYEAVVGGGQEQPAEGRVRCGVADVSQALVRDATNQAAGRVGGCASFRTLAAAGGTGSAPGLRCAAQGPLDLLRACRSLVSVR